MSDNAKPEQGGQKKKRTRKKKNKKGPAANNDLKTDALPPEKPMMLYQTEGNSMNQLTQPFNPKPPVPCTENTVNNVTQQFSQFLLQDNPQKSVFINSGTIISGSNNVMTNSATQEFAKSQSKEVDKEKLEPYLKSKKKLIPKDFGTFSKHLGNEWSFVGLSLGLEHANLEIIKHNSKDNLREMCYEMLHNWYKKDPSQCTVGNLANALLENNKTDLIFKLPSDV